MYGIEAYKYTDRNRVRDSQSRSNFSGKVCEFISELSAGVDTHVCSQMTGMVGFEPTIEQLGTARPVH